MASAKPVIHGPDHRLGGADPIEGLGGIQFGGANPVYGENNEGEWLEVHTTGAGGSQGLGMLFQDDGGGAVQIRSDGGGVELDGVGARLGILADSFLEIANSGNFRIYDNGFGNIWLEVSEAGRVFINDHVGMDIASTVDITMTSFGSMQITSEGATLFLTAGTNATSHDISCQVGTTGRLIVRDTSTTTSYLQTGGGGTFVQLQTGTNFEVRDHSGNVIFRVDEDADLHGKTGKALTFDL